MSAIVLSVEYQVGGGSSEPTLARLSTAFERAGAETADVSRHILPRLVPVLEAGAAAQFDAEGRGPISGAWAPLSPKYAAYKQKVAPGAPILVLTGRLRDALTNGSSANALRDISGTGLTYGTKSVPYASYHQTGGSRLPARPPFDFDSETERALAAAAMAGVRDAVREASAGLLDFEEGTYTDETGATHRVMSGRGGGRFFTSGGVKTYLKKNAAGQVIKRTFGGGK